MIPVPPMVRQYPAPSPLTTTSNTMSLESWNLAKKMFSLTGPLPKSITRSQTLTSSKSTTAWSENPPEKSIVNVGIVT
jgi:hypothetical protein